MNIFSLLANYDTILYQKKSDILTSSYDNANVILAMSLNLVNMSSEQ